MNWQAWVVIGLIALSSLTTISKVGQPRKPIEPGEAAFTVLFNGVVVWLIVAAATA